MVRSRYRPAQPRCRLGVLLHQSDRVGVRPDIGGRGSDVGRFSPRRRPERPSGSAEPRQLPVVGADGTIYVVYASGHGPFLDCRNCGTLPTDYIVARLPKGQAAFERSVAAANIARTDSPTEESEAISSLAADPDPS